MVYTNEEESPPKLSMFRYNSPLIQVILIGFICFCCPGMFNALSGVGGGGQVDHTAANNANTALYTTFAVFGVLGGGIYNILGPRLTLFAGCLTYLLYAGSFISYNHNHNQTFVIVSGALLGVGAGLLWAGQGAIMTSYPTSKSKGTYISICWTILNMGGVIGGLIPFILNYHRAEAASVNDATYIGFMGFMTIGALLSLAILPPSRVIREDGTKCTLIKYSNVSTESVEILKLFTNWKMLLIVPAAWGSNCIYTYQFNNVNGALFNLRTRGFNNLFYWLAQMLGSIAIGYLMDFSFKSRRKRGYFGIIFVSVLTAVIWGGALANQLRYSKDHVPEKLDFKNSGVPYAGPFVLYFSFGLLDAMFQSLVFWVIGGLADDSETLSRYSGFFKGVQSAGAAVSWQLDVQNVSYLNQLIINWVITATSLPLLFVLVMLAVKDDSTPEVKTKDDSTPEVKTNDTLSNNVD